MYRTTFSENKRSIFDSVGPNNTALGASHLSPPPSGSIIFFFITPALWLHPTCRLLYIAFSIEIASRNQSKKKVIFSDLFEQTVCKHPDKVAIIFEEESWTFQHLDEYANRIANYFLGQGLKKGDVVALFMENCPEYVGTWLGLSKIGVVSAFVNYNLREQSLVHSIKVADACAIIFSSTLSGAIGDVMSKLDAKNLSYGCYTIKGDSYLPQTKNMQVELLSSTPSPPPPLNNKSFEGIHTVLMQFSAH